MTTYLNVPFRDRNEAKAKGARWDSEARKWFVPIGRDLEPFTTWLPVPLALALGDERLELGAGELGHVGADRLAREGWTFHYSNVLPAACQKIVSTLPRSGIWPPYPAGNL